MEAARAAIGTTGARVTARTIRARSLTVLLETVDILFAGTIRWTELFETAPDAESQQAIADALRWLSHAERAIAGSLSQRPADSAESFAPEGSHSIEYVRKREAAVRALDAPTGSLIALLAQDQRDALLNVEVAFESVRALWSGVEFRASASEADRAAHYLAELNPARRTASRRGAVRYRIEPYVLAGDVYSTAPHDGRGGWSWYTGAAAWYWRAVMESVLGVKVGAESLSLSPRIPGSWTHCGVRIAGAMRYRIDIERTAAVDSLSVLLDGVPVDPAAVPLRTDGLEHTLKVRLPLAPEI